MPEKYFPLLTLKYGKQLTFLARSVYSVLKYRTRFKKGMRANEIAKALNLKDKHTLVKVKKQLLALGLITIDDRLWMPQNPPPEHCQYNKDGTHHHNKCLHPVEGLTLHQTAILSQLYFDKNLPSAPGHKESMIAKRLGINRSTVYRAIAKFRKKGVWIDGKVTLPTTNGNNPVDAPKKPFSDIEFFERVVTHMGRFDRYNVPKLSFSQTRKALMAEGFSAEEFYYIFGRLYNKIVKAATRKGCKDPYPTDVYDSLAVLYRKDGKIIDKVRRRREKGYVSRGLLEKIIWEDFIKPTVEEVLSR